MSGKNFAFRWVHVSLPLIILIISLLLAVIFYPSLPEQVAYRFKPGGADSYAARAAFLTWTLVPQVFLVLLAAAIVWGVARLSRRIGPAEQAGMLPPRTFFLMGSMVALPQLILSFAMLDVFLYNSYQTHLMPIWAFALLVMVVGAVLLGILFGQALGRVRESSRSKTNGGTGR